MGRLFWQLIAVVTGLLLGSAGCFFPGTEYGPGPDYYGDSDEPALHPMVCVEECVGPLDCDAPLLNDAFCHWRCSREGRCEMACCSTSFVVEECLPFLSGWTDRCSDNSECNGGVCVNLLYWDYWCAVEPAPPTTTCEALGLVEVDLPCAAASDCVTATVCATETGTFGCDDGVCVTLCTADADCGPGTVCRLSTGLCRECEDDNDCTGALSQCLTDTWTCGCLDALDCSGDTPICHVDGHCGCRVDTDCDADPEHGSCNTEFGRCECHDTSTCDDGQNIHTGTTRVCKEVEQE